MSDGVNPPSGSVPQPYPNGQYPDSSMQQPPYPGFPAQPQYLNGQGQLDVYQQNNLGVPNETQTGSIPVAPQQGMLPPQVRSQSTPVPVQPGMVPPPPSGSVPMPPQPGMVPPPPSGSVPMPPQPGMVPPPPSGSVPMPPQPGMVPPPVAMPMPTQPGMIPPPQSENSFNPQQEVPQVPQSWQTSTVENHTQLESGQNVSGQVPTPPVNTGIAGSQKNINQQQAQPEEPSYLAQRVSGKMVSSPDAPGPLSSEAKEKSGIQPRKKRRVALIVTIAVVVVALLVGGGIGTYFLWFKKSSHVETKGISATKLGEPLKDIHSIPVFEPESDFVFNRKDGNFYKITGVNSQKVQLQDTKYAADKFETGDTASIDKNTGLVALQNKDKNTIDIYTFDLENGKQLKTVSFGSDVLYVSLNNDHYIATAYKDCTVKVMDLDTGKQTTEFKSNKFYCTPPKGKRIPENFVNGKLGGKDGYILATDEQETTLAVNVESGKINKLTDLRTASKLTKVKDGFIINGLSKDKSKNNTFAYSTDFKLKAGANRLNSSVTYNPTITTENYIKGSVEIGKKTEKDNPKHTQPWMITDDGTPVELIPYMKENFNVKCSWVSVTSPEQTQFWCYTESGLKLFDKGKKNAVIELGKDFQIVAKLDTGYLLIKSDDPKAKEGAIYAIG